MVLNIWSKELNAAGGMSFSCTVRYSKMHVVWICKSNFMTPKVIRHVWDISDEVYDQLDISRLVIVLCQACTAAVFFFLSIYSGLYLDTQAYSGWGQETGQMLNQRVYKHVDAERSNSDQSCLLGGSSAPPHSAAEY